MKIPAGTSVYVGRPAKPMLASLADQISSGLADIPGILEAHVPQCYAKGLIDPPAQILVLVLPLGMSADTVVPGVLQTLRRILPRGTSMDVLPLDEKAPVLSSIRGAGCQLSLRSLGK